MDTQQSISTANLILAIITALGGTAGITSVITTIFQRKKMKAEAESVKIQNDKAVMDYVTNALKNLSETYKSDQEKLKEELQKQKDLVADLNRKLASLMNWIVNDNHKYRSWLESKLRECDPDIELPEVSDPPNVFQVSKDD